MLAVSLNIPLGQSEVKDEYFVGSFVQADAEIIRLDVSVDEMPVVHILNSGNHLIDQHEDCLERELAESLVEQ